MKPINDVLLPYLDPNDPGESAEDFQRRNRDQDDAFRAAMEKAMQRGKEAPRKGIRTTSIEGAVLRPIRAETFVPTASSIALF
jgi:hypothetical protein